MVLEEKYWQPIYKDKHENKSKEEAEELNNDFILLSIYFLYLYILILIGSYCIKTSARSSGWSLDVTILVLKKNTFF